MRSPLPTSFAGHCVGAGLYGKAYTRGSIVSGAVPLEGTKSVYSHRHKGQCSGCRSSTGAGSIDFFIDADCALVHKGDGIFEAHECFSVLLKRDPLLPTVLFPGVVSTGFRGEFLAILTPLTAAVGSAHSPDRRSHMPPKCSVRSLPFSRGCLAPENHLSS